MKIITLNFVIGLLLITNVLLAQKKDTITCKIEWKSIKKDKSNDILSHSYLNFEGCVINNINVKIPDYKIKIKHETDEILNGISIIDCKYIELTSEEDSLILDQKDKIGKELLLNKSQSSTNLCNSTTIYFIPIRCNPITNRIEKLSSFKLLYLKDRQFKSMDRSTIQNSVLATGKWYKVAVKNTGVHKITYKDLADLGVNTSNINSHQISIYGNGPGMLPELNSKYRFDDLHEIAIDMHDGNDNTFDQNDYFLFYGQSQVSWNYNNTSKLFEHTYNIYSDYTYYYIVIDSTIGSQKRMQTKNSLSANPDHYITKFDDFAYHEKDLYNVAKTGKAWVGERFDNIVSDYTFPFNFTDLDATSTVNIKTNLVASSTVTSQFNININGHAASNVLIQKVNGSSQTVMAFAGTSNDTLTCNNSLINVNIVYDLPLNTSVGWLNYIEVNAKRKLRFSGTQLQFRSTESVGSGSISKFTINNSNSFIKVWDVSDPLNVNIINTSLTGTDLNFTLNTDSLKEFIAFNSASFYTPELIGAINNQNLHGLAQQDMIIVSYPDFISEANRLADIHRNNDNLKVTVVTPTQIYNEFSSGSQDPIAIRMFMKLFYDRATTLNELPKYLLLFGRASYDFKNRLDNNTNYVVTYESNESFDPSNSYVTDDMFGFLDNNESGESGLDDLDIGIGRFPVTSLDQAKGIVDKIERYTIKKDLVQQNSSSSNTISNLADWKNTICFVADDEEGNSFFIDSETLATNIKTKDSVFNIDKVYLDSYPQVSTPGGQRYPEVNSAINQRVEKGALIINYVGHGGELGWTHERVLEVSDIENWSNTYNMPLYITATCEFSRFDDPIRNAAGELVLLNKNGGGIALITTSRLTYGPPNQDLNLCFLNRAFKKTNSKYPRLGDLLKDSKNDNGNRYVLRNFVLLGDPAIRLAYPEYNIKTTEINNQIVNSSPDTIKSLSTITVKGIITDDNSNKINSFNGIIYPVVYDKPMIITTLINDPATNYTPQNFELQKNILYKGKASVVNGEFTFSFIVPKDIAYQYGFGKISYYAQNGTTDASGFYNNIVIGGTDTDANTDITGPSIRLYLNDTNFVFGGITNENPLLLALLIDSNGINTVGNGIGHNIVAVLDGDNENPIILNDYYSSALDNYKKGTIRYPFFKLSSGTHSLKLKVWDVFNNSAEAYTEFIVSESAQLVLNNLLNYPNPFYDNTYFVFEHNQSGIDLNVLIQIYDINGKLVKQILKTINNEGFKTDPIEWNGTTDSGEKIGKGIYVYRLTLKKPDGTAIEKTNKLVFLR